MSIWYTSDEHYYHANIIKFSNRPFLNLAHMHKVLIENHNDVVSKNDTVIHVGDFTLHATETEVKIILEQLNGKHWIMTGNHDRHRDSLERVGFNILNQPDEYSINWQILKNNNDRVGVILSHYPYFNSNPEFDQRYVDRRPKDTGKWLIHGHVHQAWQIQGHQINVGVDVWNYTPVPEETLYELITKEVE